MKDLIKNHTIFERYGVNPRKHQFKQGEFIVMVSYTQDIPTSYDSEQHN